MCTLGNKHIHTLHLSSAKTVSWGGGKIESHYYMEFSKFPAAVELH